MGKKGPTRHLKRHYSPRFWPIHRKEKVWAIRTNPGPHTLKTSLPSKLVVRDVLKFASNGREAKSIIKKGKIMVDGTVRTSERFPLGLMDVLSLPDAKEIYRVLPGHKGKLILHPINEDESKYKLHRITGKTSVKKGFIQIHLHDGKNILLPEEESQSLNLNDVLKTSIPDMEILSTIVFEQGVKVLISGGRRQGERGTLTLLGNEPGKKTTAVVRTPNGEDILTLEQYVFAIGKEEPEINLPVLNLFEKTEE